MTSSITIPDSLSTKGALVVLGGESRQDMLRSNLAAQLYWALNFLQNRDIPIVTTGYCSGLTSVDARPSIEDAESARARRFLTDKKHIPARIILSENQSLDTLTNFVFAEPLLRQIDAKNIGVIVDQASAARVLGTAKRVLGKAYDIDIYGVDEPSGAFARFVIEAVYLANRIDTRAFGAITGSHTSWIDYVRKHHPFYARDLLGRVASLYGVGVLGMKAIKGAEKYLAKESQ